MHLFRKDAQHFAFRKLGNLANFVAPRCRSPPSSSPLYRPPGSGLVHETLKPRAVEMTAVAGDVDARLGLARDDAMMSTVGANVRFILGWHWRVSDRGLWLSRVLERHYRGAMRLNGYGYVVCKTRAETNMGELGLLSSAQALPKLSRSGSEFSGYFAARCWLQCLVPAAVEVRICGLLPRQNGVPASSTAVTEAKGQRHRSAMRYLVSLASENCLVGTVRQPAVLELCGHVPMRACC